MRSLDRTNRLLDKALEDIKHLTNLIQLLYRELYGTAPPSEKTGRQTTLPEAERRKY